MVAARRLRFPLLRDESNEVAEAFGLRWTLPDDLRKLYLQFGIDLAESNGEDGWTLPVPARYVIETDGVVRSASVDVDYTVRPEPGETLEALRILT